jgi:hypothetical protein
MSLNYVSYLILLSPNFSIGFHQTWLILVYQGEPANTPADDHWWASLTYKFSNSSQFEKPVNISFLPTGELDLQRTSQNDLTLANALLAPTIDLLHSQTTHEFDFWKLMNWLLVSTHWTFLYGLGQTTPTTYPPRMDGYSPLPDFSNPTSYPDTNNIFVNSTLFQIYSTYLRETLSPLLNLSVPEFLPLNETNKLYPQQVTFVRTYDCQERTLKSGWVFSVFAVDFAFASGAYTLVLLIAGIYERRRLKKLRMNCESSFVVTNGSLLLSGLCCSHGWDSGG